MTHGSDDENALREHESCIADLSESALDAGGQVLLNRVAGALGIAADRIHRVRLYGMPLATVQPEIDESIWRAEMLLNEFRARLR